MDFTTGKMRNKSSRERVRSGTRSFGQVPGGGGTINGNIMIKTVLMVKEGASDERHVLL
jgi:hypothetical protein